MPGTRQSPIAWLRSRMGYDAKPCIIMYEGLSVPLETVAKVSLCIEILFPNRSALAEPMRSMAEVF